jgi:hypothetical protein
VAEVAVFRMVTIAAGTAAPEASVTRPEMDAVPATWANR